MDFGKIFTNNKNIVAVKIGDNIDKIEHGAFTNCENLKYIVLGSNVKTFEYGVVGGKKLEHIELNDGLEEFGTGSTTMGIALGNEIDIEIPDSVTNLCFWGAKTVIVKEGSSAESYAKENNMDYRVE